MRPKREPMRSFVAPSRSMSRMFPSRSARIPNQATSASRRLQISVDVQIVDQTNGKTLWERKGLSAEGEYAERNEPDGRRQALERIVNDVIDGAQSQW